MSHRETCFPLTQTARVYNKFVCVTYSSYGRVVYNVVVTKAYRHK